MHVSRLTNQVLCDILKLFCACQHSQSGTVSLQLWRPVEVPGPGWWSGVGLQADLHSDCVLSSQGLSSQQAAEAGTTAG